MKKHTSEQANASYIDPAQHLAQLVGNPEFRKLFNEYVDQGSDPFELMKAVDSHRYDQLRKQLSFNNSKSRRLGWLIVMTLILVLASVFSAAFVLLRLRELNSGLAQISSMQGQTNLSNDINGITTDIQGLKAELKDTGATVEALVPSAQPITPVPAVSPTMSVVPSPQSVVLTPSVKLSLENSMILTLPMTLNLHGSGLNSLATASVVFTTPLTDSSGVTHTVSLERKSVIGPDTAFVYLPETLLSSVPAFDAKTQVLLRLGPQFIDQELVLTPTVVVKGVDQAAYSSGSVLPGDGGGALIWKREDAIGVLPQDAIHPRGIDDSRRQYVLLRNGDLVRILKGSQSTSGFVYYIQVVSNVGDGDNAVGAEGWILRSIIDGKP